MPSYWPRAHRWAKEATRAWSPMKAVPSVLGLIAQWTLDLQPMTRALVMALTVILGYVVTYVLHYLWHLLISAPAALDRASRVEIEAATAEIANLKRPTLSPREQAEHDRLKDAIAKFDQEELVFLVVLLDRVEWRFDELRARLTKKEGCTTEAWKAFISKARESVLFEEDRPTPAQPLGSIRINPVYRATIAELLHSGR